MLLNEKGLVKALKRSYSVEGYNVANLGKQAAVYGADWFIKCDWSELPRKALATIVEHMGLIPSDGEAAAILKNGDPQTIMPEIVKQDMKEWTTGKEGRSVTMVPVLLQGLQLYQQVTGRVCYGVNPICLAIVERQIAELTAAKVMDSRLAWESDGETVVITASRKSQSWTAEWEKEVWTALESINLHKRED